MHSLLLIPNSEWGTNTQHLVLEIIILFENLCFEYMEGTRNK